MRGRWFLVVDFDGDYGIVDAATGRVNHLGQTDTILYDVATNMGGEVYGITNYSIVKVDPRTGNTTHFLSLPTNSATGFEFYIGEFVVTDAYGWAYRYDRLDGSFESFDLPGDGRSAGDITYLFGSYYMSSADSTIRKYHWQLNEEEDILYHGIPRVFGLSVDSEWNLVGFADDTLYVIDPDTGAVLRSRQLSDPRYTEIWSAADAQALLHLAGIDEEPTGGPGTDWIVRDEGFSTLEIEPGTFAGPDDHDWIRLETAGGVWYRIELRSSYLDDAVKAPDPGFVLRNSQGQIVYASIDKINRDSVLEFYSPDDSIWYVDMFENFGRSGAYIVDIDRTDTPEEPDLLGAYWLPERGAISERSERSGDHDMFALEASAGETVTVRLAPGGDASVLAGARARLAIKTESGSFTLAEATAGRDGVLILSGTAPDDGWVGVEVWTSAPGTYRVERLSGAFMPPLARDDHERVSPADLRKGAVAIRVLDNDEPGSGKIDKNSLTVTDGPDHGEIVGIRNGTLFYRPDAGFSGTDSFTYTVADRNGLRSAPATVTVEVEPVQPPDARDDVFTISPRKPGKPIVLDVLSNDVAGTFPIDKKSLVIQVAPEHGSAVVRGSKIYYTPNPLYNGPDSFTYAISSKNVHVVDSASVSLNVTSPPPPKARWGRLPPGKTLLQAVADVAFGVYDDKTVPSYLKPMPGLGHDGIQTVHLGNYSIVIPSSVLAAVAGLGAQDINFSFNLFENRAGMYLLDTRKEKIMILGFEGTDFGSRLEQLYDMPLDVLADIVGYILSFVFSRYTPFFSNWIDLYEESGLIELIEQAAMFYKPDRLVITGHSLGGILADMFADRLLDHVARHRPDLSPYLKDHLSVVTFGSPGVVGSLPSYVETLNVVHDFDPIALVGSVLGTREGADLHITKPLEVPDLVDLGDIVASLVGFATGGAGGAALGYVRSNILEILFQQHARTSYEESLLELVRITRSDLTGVWQAVDNAMGTSHASDLELAMNALPPRTTINIVLSKSTFGRETAEGLFARDEILVGGLLAASDETVHLKGYAGDDMIAAFGGNVDAEGGAGADFFYLARAVGDAKVDGDGAALWFDNENDWLFLEGEAYSIEPDRFSLWDWTIHDLQDGQDILVNDVEYVGLVEDGRFLRWLVYDDQLVPDASAMV